MKELSAMALAVKQSSTLSITAKAKELRAQGLNVIGFGAGEPDFDTPEHIGRAGIEAIEAGFTKYTPGAGIEELRKAICKKLKEDNGLDYEFSQIIISNGAKHSLNNILTALLNPGDEVIVPCPFWLSYPEMVKMAGGIPKILMTEEADGFRVTRAQLDKSLSPATKAIIINSPNNPTGVVYDEATLRVIADFAVENDLYVISDEIYEKLIYDDDLRHISIASFSEELYRRTIVVNGLSKSYSMTGWRIGYTASPKEIAKVMSNLQGHGTSNPNSIAQKAALAALQGDQSPIELMRQAFQKRRDYIYERAMAIPHITAVKPQGAFYLFINVSALFGRAVKGVQVKNAGDLAELLLTEQNVAVVPCGDFGSDRHIRLSYAISMEEIQQGMDRIEAFVREHYSV